MRYRHVVVEGSIGAGKTSLATRLAADFGAKLILEQFAENPFLPLFYEQPQRYAFPVELFFLAERYQQLRDAARQPDLFANLLISDYLFVKSALFASINLKGDELLLFQRLASLLQAALPDPDLVIYLHAPTEKLLQQIQQRGRAYEQRISADYLSQIQQRYLQYFKGCRFPVLIVDTTHLDFVADERHYGLLRDWLLRDIHAGIHWITPS